MPRITPPLTDTFVRQAKHSDKPSDDKHRDGWGLYLQVTPSQGKYWRLDYRLMGKRLTLALDVYPVVAQKCAKSFLLCGSDCVSGCRSVAVSLKPSLSLPITH